jgi:hypothetical protein
MPYDSQKARQEIQTVIEDTEGEPHLDLFCAISDYLGTGPPSIKPALDGLERQLRERLGDELSRAVEYFRAQSSRAQINRALMSDRSPHPTETSPYSKLLTNYMKRLEVQHGFNPEMNPVYVGALTTAEFGRRPQHFKDLVSAPHGEFSHRLQWYLLMETGKIPDNAGKATFELVIKIPQLFQTICDLVRAGEPPVAWGSSDFRCPEFLTAYLCSPELADNCPLIGNFISSRNNKRGSERGEEKIFTWKNDYVARKLFFLPYDKCGSDQKRQIEDVVKSKVVEKKP